jgi:hypothetical protein
LEGDGEPKLNPRLYRRGDRDVARRRRKRSFSAWSCFSSYFCFLILRRSISSSCCNFRFSASRRDSPSRMSLRRSIGFFLAVLDDFEALAAFVIPRSRPCTMARAVAFPLPLTALLAAFLTAGREFLEPERFEVLAGGVDACHRSERSL